MLVPTDSQGLKCGLDPSVIDRPYLIFFDISKCAEPSTPITGCKTPQVCVKECPTTNFIYRFDAMKNLPVGPIVESLICIDSFDKGTLKFHEDIQAAVDANECAWYYLKSTHCEYFVIINILSIDGVRLNSATPSFDKSFNPVFVLFRLYCPRISCYVCPLSIRPVNSF